MMECFEKVQPAGSLTGNGSVVTLPLGCTHVTVYAVGGAGVTAGAVTLETAHKADYAGDWAPVGSALTVVADDVEIIQAVGTFKCVRVRISTTVDGGGVEVFLLATGPV